jgi:hypothetical protein
MAECPIWADRFAENARAPIRQSRTLRPQDPYTYVFALVITAAAVHLMLSIGPALMAVGRGVVLRLRNTTEPPGSRQQQHVMI